MKLGMVAGMSTYSSAFYLKSALAGLISLASVSASAAEVSIFARFSPDPADPYNDTFRNTTPNSGYCSIVPAQCKLRNQFSIAFSGSTNWSPIAAEHTDVRQGAMIKVPGDWRSVSIIGPHGISRQLELRIVGFGAAYALSTNVEEIAPSHGDLWYGRSWLYSPSPCVSSGHYIFNQHSYTFFWGTPSSAVCGKTARVDIPSLTLRNFNFMYELRAPNPLDMPLGTYTGQLNYTMGPGQDFDFGDLLIPDESLLTVNFSLEVLHLLKVQFPPGSDRLSLNPQGGWQQWVLHGRRPEKLFANQNFQLWASSPFKMQLQCQYTVSDQCGIQNEVGDLVPVETRITLPPGLLNSTNAPVNRHLLSISTPSIFHPSYYVDDGRATLNFEVGKSSVAQMTNHSGSRYAGNVTVVWDADI